jgi:photosystem II stability/assembly factor-like uncharacterized protein
MRTNMGRRASHARVPAAAAACLLLLTPLAGCGASRSGQPATPPPPAAASSRPVSPAASAVPVPTPSPCAGTARLAAGMTLASWRLGAVHFVSPGIGVAITAPQIPCAVPLGNGQGTNIFQQAQPVLLAVSTDAGHRWVTEGSALPSSGQAPVIEQVTAVSARSVWVLANTGQLYATGNGGLTWTLQPLPAPVVTVAEAGGELIALSCPLTQQIICHPELHRMRLPDGGWQREPLPRLATYSFSELAVASASAAVLLVTQYPGNRSELVSTTDGGAKWTADPVPAGPARMCAHVSGLLTIASADEWWLLCTGGAAAGSSTKVLLRTQDGGRTWHVMAALTSLSAPVAPGSLQFGDANAIAAFSPTLLWIATNNSLAYTRDAGRSWTSVTSVNPGGASGTFDILSPSDAWLAAPGTALFHTTDGIHWSQAGPSFNS